MAACSEQHNSAKQYGWYFPEIWHGQSRYLLHSLMMTVYSGNLFRRAHFLWLENKWGQSKIQNTLAAINDGFYIVTPG
jgi:hypothetical protein